MADDGLGNEGFSYLSASLGSGLTDILLGEDIVPGAQPSYQLCKLIYAYHPMGQKIAEGPINMAQSQEREITVPGGPESRLIPAFNAEWRNIGKIGADTIIKRTMVLSRVYGISVLGVGNRGIDTSEPLPKDALHEADLYFNVFDPLNTAGSLVLDQDPNSPDFQTPSTVRVAGKAWHPSRTVTMMNEGPIYIEFTSSAFGFSGRSVYQRALYPLKSFILSMIANNEVQKKIALLIWNAHSPSSAINQRMMQMFGWKRQNLKSAVTGNVLQIGKVGEEDIKSLNFQNLEGAGRFTRENILKDMATAAGGMPAKMLDMETLAEGFGEGSEDAKQIARFVDRVRIEMQPLYTVMDAIVQRRAWSPDFYAGIKKDYPEYRNVPYETAFYQWRNDFNAVWPNLITEPDSEKVKVAEVKFKSVVAMTESLAPLVQDPDNKATLVDWVAAEANEQKDLFTSPLVFDLDAMRNYTPPTPEVGDEKEPKPEPFSAKT